MNYYVLNLETSRIELQNLGKEDYNKLSNDFKKLIKSNFLFSKTAQCWVSRSTKNHYSAKYTAKQLGFTEEKEVGTRLTYQEQLEIKVNKAVKRGNKYSNYSTNANTKAIELQGGLPGYDDVAFWTQPNINTTKGRAFTRYRQRLIERYNKSFEEYRKSEYFKNKSKIAYSTAEMNHLKDKGYLQNRIDECNNVIKKVTNRLENYKGNEEEQKSIKYDLDLLNEYYDKLGFFKNQLEKLGGIEFSKENIVKGDFVKIRNGLYEVVKANLKTVTVKTIVGNIKYKYAQIEKKVNKKSFGQKTENN